MAIAPRVLTSSEARTALPSLNAEIGREGIERGAGEATMSQITGDLGLDTAEFE